jgi:DNA-binding MarR family transcriptional regulator
MRTDRDTSQSGFKDASRAISIEDMDLFGAEKAFRQILHKIQYVGEIHAAVRRHLASEMKLTPPQFNILLAIGEFEGSRDVGVKDIAEHLHVTGAFITVETNKLEARQLVIKMQNPNDGRGTLLRLSSRAQAELQGIAERIRQYNARFFDQIKMEEFTILASYVNDLVSGGESALVELSTPRAIHLVARRRSPR